jgi:hypothetical protein
MLTSQRKKFANSYAQNLTWTIRIQASFGPRVVEHQCKPKHTCLWETTFFLEWHHNPRICACISGWKFRNRTKLNNLHTCCSQEAHCSATIVYLVTSQMGFTSCLHVQVCVQVWIWTETPTYDRWSHIRKLTVQNIWNICRF